jgi:hypothetical protein
MPFVAAGAKRPSAFLADDQRCLAMSAIDNGNLRLRGLLREMCGSSIREFWRKLARPVTFFDEHSPSIFSAREIGEFFRKWRARQGSNLRPPA